MRPSGESCLEHPRENFHFAGRWVVAGRCECRGAALSCFDMTHVPQKTVPFTYREYALLPDDGRRHELIEGEFCVTPAPSPLHQQVSGRLYLELAAQLKRSAMVLYAPLDVILNNTTVAQPDIVVLRKGRRNLVSKRGIEGPPDLVVEILSPGNRAQDEVLKRAVYARFGIPEYWIVDPEQGFITVFRAEQGAYSLSSRFDRSTTLTSSEFPELKIALAPIFDDPP